MIEITFSTPEDAIDESWGDPAQYLIGPVTITRKWAHFWRDMLMIDDPDGETIAFSSPSDGHLWRIDVSAVVIPELAPYVGKLVDDIVISGRDEGRGL